jgi:hypothetical protein
MSWKLLKRKKVAVISGDTTGYGTASVNSYVPMLKAKGAELVHQGNVDAANPDLKPELAHAKPQERKRSCPGASMPVSCHASSTRAGSWNGTCRSSARPRSVWSDQGIAE